MSEMSQAPAPAANADQKSQAVTGRTREILSGPLGGLLMRMSAPNIVAMLVQTAASFAEVWFVGQLGTVALAGLALVFPMFMLMMMLSGGAMGGAVSAAMAQALGRDREAHAEVLIWNALAIALLCGLVFSALFLVWGREIFTALGADAAVVRQALAYSNILFAGATLLWIFNILSSLLRGMGDMKSPAFAMLGATFLQIPLGGALILGWGPFPAVGIAGVPISSLAAILVATLYLFWRLSRPTVRVAVRLTAARLNLPALWDILRIGLMASLSPFLSIATIILLTALVARFSTEAIAGYGIGTRLEFLIIPVVWGIGAALTTIVGTNIGAGNIDRAHRAAWLGGVASLAIAGGLGLLVAIFPAIWATWFTDDPVVYDTAVTYLRIAGPLYGLQGLGLCLYFASQGAGAMTWPIIAGVGRISISVLGGWLWLTFVEQTLPAIFAFVAGGMASYGLITAVSIYFGAWRRVARKRGGMAG